MFRLFNYFTLLFVWLAISANIVFADGQKETAPVTPKTMFPGIHKLKEAEFGGYSKDLGPTFSVPNHKDQISKLKDQAKECTEKLMDAQWKQDIEHQFQSKAHFDNCAFDDATEYISTLYNEASAQFSKGKPLDGMFSVGQAIHAVQDFYAHSNFVEIMTKQKDSLSEVDIVPVWTNAGAEELRKLSSSQGLYSGTVWWGLPKKCSENVPSHGDLNKDSNSSKRGKEIISEKWESMTYHQAARLLSERATIAFLDYVYKNNPQVAASCGKTVGFLQLHDKRP